ncbi:unnamed protein product [Paramecium pentaurelia]|uniref:Uncharacterized protein n=1 Tax=Paramecium pentaurelia TaxID=43138 RepID=A0A8S1VBR9_9CILI|nr:unnamed protein product [Paramecium pentaurelia]
MNNIQIQNRLNSFCVTSQRKRNTSQYTQQSQVVVKNKCVQFQKMKQNNLLELLLMDTGTRMPSPISSQISVGIGRIPKDFFN